MASILSSTLATVHQSVTSSIREARMLGTWSFAMTCLGFLPNWLMFWCLAWRWTPDWNFAVHFQFQLETLAYLLNNGATTKKYFAKTQERPGSFRDIKIVSVSARCGMLQELLISTSRSLNKPLKKAYIYSLNGLFKDSSSQKRKLLTVQWFSFCLKKIFHSQRLDNVLISYWRLIFTFLFVSK